MRPGTDMHTRRPRPRREGGFTLIEVLLAVGITATVMLTVASSFRVLLNARDVVEDLSESTEAGPRILNLIERDLSGLWTFNVHDNAVLRGRDMDIGGRDADRLDFLTTSDAVGYVLDNQNQPRRPTLCEVGYWFKPNPKFRELFEMWRREDPMVDGDLITQGTFQLVHDRIKSFKVTYYESLGYEAEPKNEWDTAALDELPARIKIEFTVERRRSSRNVVSDSEIEDFEGAEKTYVRHFTFDKRMQRALTAGRARIPVPPPGAPAGGEGEGGAGESGRPNTPGGPSGAPVAAGANGRTNQTTGRGDQGDFPGRGQGGRNNTVGNGLRPTGQTPGGRANGVPSGLPPGFNLGDLLRGAGGGNAGGLGGLFGGGGAGGR